jgi:signal transduction histidine kinase
VSHIVTHTLKFNQQREGGPRKKLADLLDSAAAIYIGRMKSSGIRLEKDYAEDTLGESIAMELRQVFSNLIGNAFDATRSGGKIVLRTRKTRDREGRAAIRVTVADTGHGMDRQTMSRIFEPFYTTKGASGTGLGLWITADILKRQHARMRVRSTQKQGHSGTVFSLMLPVPQEPQSGAHETAAWADVNSAA